MPPSLPATIDAIQGGICGNPGAPNFWERQRNFVVAYPTFNQDLSGFGTVTEYHYVRLQNEHCVDTVSGAGVIRKLAQRECWHASYYGWT
jgi:hypothetical protein